MTDSISPRFLIFQFSWFSFSFPDDFTQNTQMVRTDSLTTIGEIFKARKNKYFNLVGILFALRLQVFFFMKIAKDSTSPYGAS